MMPPKVSLLKITETKAITNLYENNHIIQDLLVPVKYLKESIRKFHDAVQVRSRVHSLYKEKSEEHTVFTLNYENKKSRKPCCHSVSSVTYLIQT